MGRFACVRQHDQSDCGAAALATVARHHRLPIGLQKMRDLCGTDRVGTNLLGLVEAAERLGFSARAAKGPYESLREIPLPAIAHVLTEEGHGHFVVLHRVTKKGVVIADPARGIVRLEREAFAKLWTGYVLLLAPDNERRVRVDADKGAPPMRRFFGLLRPHWHVLGEAFVCAVLMTVLGVATSYFIQHLVHFHCGVFTLSQQKGHHHDALETSPRQQLNCLRWVWLNELQARQY